MTPRAPQSIGWIDWALTICAAVVLAYLLGAAQAQRPTGDTVAEVRGFELPAKIFDAGRAIDPEVQRLIGLEPDDEDAPAKLLDLMEEELRARPWAHRLRLVFVCTALIFDHDERAVMQLDEVAESPEALEAHRVAIANLHRLSRGEPATDLPGLVSDLNALGCSEWLTMRVVAKHLSYSGRSAEASAKEHAAIQLAKTHSELLTLGGGILLSLAAVGLLLLIAWPFIRRSLLAAGARGLKGTVTMFVPSSTQRVLATWFLGYVGITLLLEWLATSLPATPQAVGVQIAALTLAQGAIAIAAIQRWGRVPNDRSPLSLPLRLSVSTLPGGMASSALWVLAGLSGLIIMVLCGLVMALSVNGHPPAQQEVVQVFAQNSEPGVRLAIIATGVIIAPTIEEILFRGFLFRNLRDQLGPFTAMLASGLIFGIAHLQPDLIIPLTALGATLAFLYEWTGSLLIPIAVHGLYNLGMFAAVHVQLSG